MTPLGTRVKRLRLERGLSQKELAVAARVTRSWLSLVEGGNTESPSADMLDRLAIALGTTTTYLLTGREDRRTDTTSITVSSDDAPLLRHFNRLPRWMQRALLKMADSLIEEVPISGEDVDEQEEERHPTGQANGGR